MAKPKKPSMLTRQRQLKAQKDQVKQASEKKLPPSGGSSGSGGGQIVRRPNSLPVPVRAESKKATPALPPGKPGGPLAIKRNGGNRAAVVAAIAAPVVDAAAKGIANAYGRAVNKERSQRAAESGQRGRYIPGDQQVQFNKTKQPAEKKPATPPVKATAQRTTAMPASRMTPPIPKPKQETKATAQSYRDKEDVKGLSVGRYRTLAEHLAAVQANKAMKISSKMDTKSDVYTPSTKVDGSKLDTSKVTDKTEEYDKKKRKKLS